MKYKETLGRISRKEMRALNNPLKPIVEEHRGGVRTPEMWTAYWQTKLRVDGAKTGIDIQVPDCNWTEEEIRRPMLDVKGNPVEGMMVYNPGLSLLLLGNIYPKMDGYFISNYPFISDMHESEGWIKVEGTINTPNLNTTQKDLEDFAERTGYLGQRLSTYILASQASKDLNGQYLDREYSRLLGFGSKDFISIVRTRHNGELFIGWGASPLTHYPSWGGRFEEVKRA